MRERLNDHQTRSNSPRTAQNEIAISPAATVSARDKVARVRQGVALRAAKRSLISPATDSTTSSGRNDQFQACTAGSSWCPNSQSEGILRRRIATSADMAHETTR